MFLIDCGEGTQVQLRKHKIKFSRINHIFFFFFRIYMETILWINRFDFYVYIC